VRQLHISDNFTLVEFGYLNLKPEQSNTFFKLMEERYRRHSTMVTTNLLCGAPHNKFNAESVFMRSEQPIAAGQNPLRSGGVVHLAILELRIIMTS
jgi:hypothetical protein